MLARINRNYPSVFDEFFGREYYPAHYRSNGFKSTPAVNISEDDNGFTIEVAAPGLEKKNFKTLARYYDLSIQKLISQN